MNNLGIILPHIGASQLVEEVINSIQGKNCTLFIENIVQPYRKINFPIMNISESIFFSGRLISFSLFSAQYSLANLQNVSLEYYIYDLPWLRGYTDLISNNKILRNPNLKLFTRSDEYANLINKYTNKEVKVLQIGELINGQT